MHQTFYIDVDEEITSVISRLRKSPTIDNILVIPQRAMILQSIVNLKLLKKEAEVLKKKLLIVCQDKQGAIMAEKSGLPVQASLEGMQDDEELKEEMHPEIKGIHPDSFVDANKPQREFIGSDDFFDYLDNQSGTTEEEDEHLSQKDNVPVEPRPERIINKELVRFDEISVSDAGKGMPKEKMKSKNLSDVFPFSKKNKVDLEKQDNVKALKKQVELTPQKESEFSHLFSPSETTQQQYGFSAKGPLRQGYSEASGPASSWETDKHAVTHKKGNTFKKMIILLIILVILGVAGMAVYFLLPETRISLEISDADQMFNVEIAGDTNAEEMNVSTKTVPAKMVEKDILVESPFNATGKGTASDQKATGKVTIYNEFGSTSQVLVASTRLETEDKKIFRLQKTVTVPGMKEEGAEKVPGVIEVDVIADQSGDSYNVAPTTFKIPGFVGGPKYEKFYAKSTKPMTGGGSKANSDSTTISSDDVKQAKTQADTEFEKKYKQELAKELGEEYVFIDQAVEKKILSEGPSANVGTASKIFDYQIKGQIRALAVKKEDMMKFIAQSQGIKAGGEITLSNQVFTDVKVDFDKGVLNFKSRGQMLSEPKIDLDKFKDDIKSKDNDALAEVLRDYPQIDNMEVEYWPNFMPERVSKFPDRIKIEVSS